MKLKYDYINTNYKSTIISQFEYIVSKYPNKLAIVGSTQKLTYQELLDKVNTLSNNLTMDSMYIYLLFEHDISMIIAMLSVLRISKAYIPLDPYHPIERSNYIISNSKGKVILTNSRNIFLAKQLVNINDNDIEIVNIDTIEDVCENHAEKNEDSNNVAYILYTSGSTGKPKGVIQNNENILYFISNYTKKLNITHEDNLTLFSTYSFDASVMDIYTALLNGATLYPYSIKKNGAIDNLKNWIYENNITIFHSVPTLYRYFISKIGEDFKLLQNIRLVVMGGEAVLVNDVEMYKQYFSDDCIFINGLGPTESTVTLQYLINKHTEIKTAVVPVGYPIEQMTVYILNEDNKEVTTNEIGELVYSSEHLALGYLNMEVETNRVFITDPIKGYGRAFKTGDLARRNVYGLIEFYGRNDFQIKVRGYRIELSEIESILDKHHNIYKSIVMPLDVVNNEKQIIAYYSMIKESETSAEDLKEYLLGILPDYMIPNYFFPLNEFPLTATGKIDRKFIMDNFKPNINSYADIPPRDKFEKEIFNIWVNVLCKSNFGVNTDFVQIGGDSLMSTTIAAELEELYNVQIELVALSKLNTIENLANYIKEKLC